MRQQDKNPSTGSDISLSGGVNVQLVHRYRVKTNSYLEGFPPSNNNDESLNELLAVEKSIYHALLKCIMNEVMVGMSV